MTCQCCYETHTLFFFEILFFFLLLPAAAADALREGRFNLGGLVIAVRILVCTYTKNGNVPTVYRVSPS